MKWIFLLSLIWTASCRETTQSSLAKDHKSQSRFLTSDKQVHHHSKVRSYYQVEVQRLGSGSGEVLLRANVLATSPQPQTHIEWQLPRDVQPVEGSLQEVYDAQPGVPVQFQLLIQEDQLQENDQIFVFVYHMVDDIRYGLSQSYIYSTEESKETRPQSLDKSKKTPRFLQ